MTEYFEAQGTDEDVALFLVSHANQLNIWYLPVKTWAAREDGRIVAALMLSTQPYVAIDLIVGEPSTRPFMRIMRLWKLAEAWLREHKVPMVCAPIKNHMVHFQSLVKRLGFVPAGEEIDADGNAVETIFAKHIEQPATLH